jgi:hypothetical protein
MSNVSLFPNLTIQGSPELYDEGMTLEFYAYDTLTQKKFPRLYKFVFFGPGARALVGMIKHGMVVRICAIPEAYKGYVYGFGHERVKASNGKYRRMDKSRYHVQMMQVGEGYENIQEKANQIIEEAIRNGKNTLFHRP